MKFTMTPRGYRALREDLIRLKAMRPELANAIEVARGHGDLSENADYDAAKEKSAMTESQIRDLEAKISMAEIIDPRKLQFSDRVVFGVTVEILDVDTYERKRITIVGADEANVEKGLISYESPLGRALIGKELGDVAKVKLPAFEKEYSVEDIVIDYIDNEK